MSKSPDGSRTVIEFDPRHPVTVFPAERPAEDAGPDDREAA
jgi:hypothetical protein